MLGVEGHYSACEIVSDELSNFLAHSLTQDWAGFNLTMPLKESVFSSDLIVFDELSDAIRSANTLLRDKDRYRATSTDATAFSRLFSPMTNSRVAIIGGGGTARAALWALSDKAESVDFLLRTPSRLDQMERIAPRLKMRALPMDSLVDGYDLVINTTPQGGADHLVQRLKKAEGLYFESLYKPWPTELAFAWRELGGRTLNGIDLLVEQALDALAVMLSRAFDYEVMRRELLTVALQAIAPQQD